MYAGIKTQLIQQRPTTNSGSMPSQKRSLSDRDLQLTLDVCRDKSAAYLKETYN